MKEIKKEVKYIFVTTSLLLVVLILSCLLIRTNSKISYFKKKYDYVINLKKDIDYMTLEYDKLLQLDNENKEVAKNNTTLENNIKNLEKDILNLQEKIVKLGNTK